MMTTQRAKLIEPLRTVTALFGGLLLSALGTGVALTLLSLGSFGGFGDATICAAQPNAGYTSSNWTSNLGVAHRPGTWIIVNGTLSACAAHPSIGQRILYTLMSLPTFLTWGWVLFLLWRVIRDARRAGPFTVQVAVAMRRLGWVIIVATALAAAVQGFALDQLMNTMLVARDHFGDVITQPIRALLPVPVLAGAALLTFARIIRLGADMDDEIRGTV